jgi:hypothetical protein
MNPKRIQLKRQKGWRKPPNTVVVARPTKWGNPYRIGSKLTDYWGPGQVLQVKDAAMAVELYEALIQARHWVGPDPDELRGKNLACWCPLSQPCHADVLLRLANRKLL